MSHRLPAFPVELAGLRVLPARLRKLLSVSLLIAYLPSCYSYQELGPTPQAALQNPPESTLYITRGGGSTVELRETATVGDSVVGLGRTHAPSSTETAHCDSPVGCLEGAHPEA
jgi:hypothetical protein